MPQIVNKRLVNEIYDRFIIDADHAWLDEWSLYFNVVRPLYPRHFAAQPYGTLGWPMRPSDWFPEIAPRHLRSRTTIPELRRGWRLHRAPSIERS